VDGGKFPDLVAVADFEPAFFAVKFEVLGFSADAGHGVDMVFGAQGREAFDLGSGINDGSVADAHFVFNNRIRADRDASAQGCSGWTIAVG
jgi:Tfp pilus tip-associated adhesin PilY1